MLRMRQVNETLKLRIKELHKHQDGQNLVEYATLLALVSLVAVASARIMGTSTSDLWIRIQVALTNLL